MLRFGYAEADITPAYGEDLCGFALRSGPVTGISDPLKARWMAISSSNEKTLLGSADLISLTRSYYAGVKKRIQVGAARNTPHVHLATTHTHSGPATVPLRHCGVMNRRYMARLNDALVSSACSADKMRGKPVEIFMGSSQCDWAFNRRHRGKAIPVDHEVLALLFRDPDSGKTLGTIANYACHPVVLGHENNSVSADYPGYLAAYVEKESKAPCLFLNGACGDINPRNEHSADVSEARRAGQAIGKKVMEAVTKAKRIDCSSVATLTTNAVIPVHQPKSAVEIDSRLQSLEKQFGMARDFFGSRVDRDIRRLKAGTYPSSVTIQLSLVTLGPGVAILFVPGELFSSIGMKLKDLALPGKLIISGFSNGSVGYLPDAQAYIDGGYEPYYANFFYDFPEFEPAVETEVLDGARRLIMQWKKQAQSA